MPQELSLPNPGRFDLKSFSDILPARTPIIGEKPGSFEGFREGLLESLAPTTPYESVVAENLINIEWELIQQRLMRDAAIRQRIVHAIKMATSSNERKLYNAARDEAYNAHIESGRTKKTWVEPASFDLHAAFAKGLDLAALAVSDDMGDRVRAYEEILGLGLDPVEMIAEAYRAYSEADEPHEAKLPELERRRREVMRDYDMVQRSRPIDSTVVEA